jgi:hypothetical protein
VVLYIVTVPCMSHALLHGWDGGRCNGNAGHPVTIPVGGIERARLDVMLASPPPRPRWDGRDKEEADRGHMAEIRPRPTRRT